MVQVAAVVLFAAALAHVRWNFAAKRTGRGGAAFVWLYSMTSAVITMPVAVGALVVGGAPVHWSWAVAIVISAALHVGYGVILQRGYAVGDMSVVYPVARSSAPLLSVLAAVVVLGEHPGPLVFVGVAAVVVGVFLIGFQPHSRARRTAVSLCFGALTGLAIATFTVWDGHAMTTFAVPPPVYLGGVYVAQSLLLAPYALVRHRQLVEVWGAHRGAVLTVAALSPLAFVLVLYAMRIAPLSVVAPMREMSIVVGALVAWRWLGEPNPAGRLAGAVIVFAGIVAVAVTG
jgi:drug/metabolite transporter (DMT)-like permease